VGNLKKDAGAVAGFIVGAFGAPVLHPFEDFQASNQYVVGFPALDVGNETDSARIVLVLGTVTAQGQKRRSPRVGGRPLRLLS
jgi:hypothetical protein